MSIIHAYRPHYACRHPVGIAERAPDLLATWLAFRPDSKETTACDPEHWIESVIVLHTMLEMGLEPTVLPEGGRMLISGAGWSAPRSKPGAPVGVMLGTWSNSDAFDGLPIDVDVVGIDERAVRTAGLYAASETFRRHAGRPVALAGGDVEGEGGLEAALRSVVDATGSGDLFIKTTRKEWSGRFQVDPSSPKGLWQQLADADMAAEMDEDSDGGHGLHWIPVSQEGSRNVLLIQGRIRPTHEYRLVVVDGRAVTGAGCIEAATPLDNEAVFDPKTEETRSDGVVVRSPELVERYVAFARAFNAEFAAEHGEGLDYSLDLCVDADTGRIAVIELNPPLNLGAYARDTRAWISALTARAERVAAERAEAINES